MRKVVFPICSFMAVLCFYGCQNQQESLQDNDLYSEMVNYSHHFASMSQTIKAYQTKTDNSDYFKEREDDIDYSVLDQKIVDYLDLYTQSNDINDWNEREVLNQASQDPAFGYDEKLVIAHSISFAYYIKSSSDYTMTRSLTAEDCYNEYKKASSRALRRALLTLAVGLLEPTLAGEALAVGMFYLDMSDAAEDYENCLSRLNQL